MQLRGSEYRSREVEIVPRGSAQKPGERDGEPARAHAEVARSCVVPQRASVGDAEALRADAVPLEVDAGRARVTLGQTGLTQSLEADVGVLVEQIGVGSCQSVYPGFQLEYLLPSRVLVLPRLFSVG